MATNLNTTHSYPPSLHTLFVPFRSDKGTNLNFNPSPLPINKIHFRPRWTTKSKHSTKVVPNWMWLVSFDSISGWSFHPPHHFQTLVASHRVWCPLTHCDERMDGVAGEPREPVGCSACVVISRINVDKVIIYWWRCCFCLCLLPVCLSLCLSVAVSRGYLIKRWLATPGWWPKRW